MAKIYSRVFFLRICYATSICRVSFSKVWRIQSFALRSINVDACNNYLRTGLLLWGTVVFVYMSSCGRNCRGMQLSLSNVISFEVVSSTRKNNAMDTSRSRGGSRNNFSHGYVSSDCSINRMVIYFHSLQRIGCGVCFHILFLRVERSGIAHIYSIEGV